MRIAFRLLLSCCPFAALASCTNQEDIYESDNAVILWLELQDGHRNHNRRDGVH